ncbi:MAG: methionine/alanine import family NSS transporter small subunit [Calditrichaeota bacterium]|nr:MAG: methionine/alanine import family NSS transporter small subunit [Calditrichota bacterium]
MSTDAIVMMILILGLMWGGFVFTLSFAVKKEKEKMENHAEH